MWPWPRPISTSSVTLINPTFWPQYTNVTDRQRDRQTDKQTGQDRQRSDSIERTVLQTVAQKRFALCYQTVVCLSCPVCPVLSVCMSVLSVCDVVVLCPNGWMDQDATWYGDRPRPGPHCVRWDPDTPKRGHSSPPFFGPCLLWPIGRPSQQLLSSC